MLYLIASRIPPDRDSYSVLKLVRHFCCSEDLGPLRMFWGPFGAASWGLLDSFWGFLGSSWSLLGGSGGPLGATWGALGEVLVSPSPPTGLGGFRSANPPFPFSTPYRTSTSLNLTQLNSSQLNSAQLKFAEII